MLYLQVLGRGRRLAARPPYSPTGVSTAIPCASAAWALDLETLNSAVSCITTHKPTQRVEGSPGVIA